MATDVSVVIPVYRNADTLEALYERIGRVFEGNAAEYEILFVDDASPDRSLEILRGLAERDPRVGVLALADNCGQNRAVLAGIGEASGRESAGTDRVFQLAPLSAGTRRFVGSGSAGFSDSHARSAPALPRG